MAVLCTVPAGPSRPLEPHGRHVRLAGNEASHHRTSRLHRRGDDVRSLGPGPRGRRPRHRLLPRLRLPRRTRRRPDHRHRPPRRRPPATSRASTPSSTSPRCPTTRCRTSTRRSPTTSTSHASVRLATLAKQAGVERFVFSSSCSLYGAGGDELARRGRPRSARSRPTASRRCGSSSARRSGRRLVLARLPPQRHGVRRVAPAARPTSSSTTSSATRSRPARCSCRATARRGGRSCTCSTSRTPSSACSTRPAMLIHNQAFNVGRERRELPHPRGRRHRGRRRARLRGELRRRCVRRRPRLPGRLLQDRAASCPGYEPAWTVRRGIEQLYEAYSGDGGMTPELFTGPQVLPAAHASSACSTSTRSTPTLRWVVSARPLPSPAHPRRRSLGHRARSRVRRRRRR